MTGGDDVNGEMWGTPFDDEAVEALLSGRLDPADAPPALRQLAELVAAARSPAPHGDRAGDDQLLADVTAVVREGAGIAPESDHRRRSMLAKILPAKAAVVIATVTVGVGAAAAATGSFPASIQTSLAGAASHVGITLPKPAGHGPHASVGDTGSTGGTGATGATGASGSTGGTGTTGGTGITGGTGTTGGTGVTGGTGTTGTSGGTGTTGTTGTGGTGTSGGTGTTGPGTTTTVPTTTTLPANTFGQCNAYEHVSKDFTDLTAPGIVHSQAFRRLTAEATASGAASVEAFCAPILGITVPTTTAPTTTTLPARSRHHGKPSNPGSNGHGHGKSGS